MRGKEDTDDLAQGQGWWNPSLEHLPALVVPSPLITTASVRSGRLPEGRRNRRLLSPTQPAERES